MSECGEKMLTILEEYKNLQLENSREESKETLAHILGVVKDVEIFIQHQMK